MYEVDRSIKSFRHSVRSIAKRGYDINKLKNYEARCVVEMEAWDVYDKQGNITGEIKTRNDVFHDGEYHLVASLWIINKNGKLLIQKRSMTKRINPGMWSITGGAVKAGESSENACVREVSEEIGLTLNPQDIELLSRSFGKDIIFDDYVIIYDFSLTEIILQADEVSEVKWASIDEIKDLFDNGQFMFDDISELDKVISYINENVVR